MENIFVDVFGTIVAIVGVIGIAAVIVAWALCRALTYSD